MLSRAFGLEPTPTRFVTDSSVAKIGLMILVLGILLSEPELSPVGVMGIAAHTAHQGLVKGELFLRVGMRKHAPWQPWVMVGIAFLLLAPAGLPITGGAVVKYYLRPVLDGANWTWIGAAVAVSAVATTLLMTRFAWVIDRTPSHPKPGWLWLGLAWLVLLVLLPFVLGSPTAVKVNAVLVPVGLLMAAAVALIAWHWPAATRPLTGLVPPGDLLALLLPLGRSALRRCGCWSVWSPGPDPRRRPSSPRWISRAGTGRSGCASALSRVCSGCC